MLKLLQSFRKEFPIVEDDITDHFDKDFESMILPKLDAEVDKEKLPAFNFETRTEIFTLNDDKMWCEWIVLYFLLK